MRKFLALLAATASGIAISIAVYAADTGSPAPAANNPGGTTISSPATAEKISQIPASGAAIVVEANKGTLLRLPRAAATVFIANPDVADVQVKSPTMIYISAKSPGQTVLYAVDSDDRVMLNSPVRVEHDLSRVRQTLSSAAPGENVTVSSVDNSLVLSGNVSSAARAERVRSLAAAIAGETKGTVINRMGVVTPNQVNIRVKVAEVDRNVLKSLGVNWLRNNPGGHINFSTTNPTTVNGNVPAQLLLGFGSAAALTQVSIEALTQEGLVSVLAEPNLTATNGQAASFLAGGEFPVPVSGSAGTAGAAATITVEFKRFGVSLDCTPTILDADHLNLKLRSEVSQLSTQGEVSVPITSTATVTIPALTVRRAETTVELGSGQSFVLAGLLQNNDIQNISKVPALGDIPILGQLFRSQQFQRNESELVIIVTPYLVRPNPAVANLASPTDGLYPAHDASQIYNGGMSRQTLPSPAKGPVGPTGQSIVGPAGFRLD